MKRYAETYLVVEDRRPVMYEINGSAVISGAYQTRRAAQRAAAGREARVLPIRVNLSEGFFNQPKVVIDIPDDYDTTTGEVRA